MINPEKGAYLNAMILFIANVDETEGVGGDAPRVTELAVSGSLGPEDPQKATRRIKDLDAMIVTISNDVLTDTIDGYARQTIEFTLTLTVSTETLLELSF